MTHGPQRCSGQSGCKENTLVADRNWNAVIEPATLQMGALWLLLNMMFSVQLDLFIVIPE
jgi:hypothetical protein